jgi:hypothetical protein
MNRTVVLILIVVLAWVGNADGKTPAKVSSSTTSTTVFTPPVKISEYNSHTGRDPFVPFGQKISVAQTTEKTNAATVGTSLSNTTSTTYVPEMFRLQAILCGQRPMVVINGDVLEMNRPSKLTVGGNELRVKVLKVDKEKVMLDVEGQKLELSLAEPPHEGVGVSTAHNKK